MCPSENPSSYQPLLNRLFDNEVGSDVTFLVGHEPETWRFPGHRCVLADANPVFKAMLIRRGDISPEQVIPIVDVDGKAFDLLMRYLYKEDVHIQSVQTALSTLYAAQKYLCPGLMRQCIFYLDQSLNVTNVLQIFEHIRVYSGQSKAASAPPFEHIDVTTDPKVEDMTTLCKSLLHNCLLVIDKNASHILVQESFDDLTRDCLSEIVERDTLDAPEYLVYNAIERWSSLECKRFQLELSSENLRTVLSEDILFSVRYLLMSLREFSEGPMKGNLLTKEEISTLYAYLHNSNVTNTTGTLTDERVAKMRKCRKPPQSSRILLGKRASAEDKKKMKEAAKKKKKKEKEDSSKKCTGACFAEYFFRALACIFD